MPLSSEELERGNPSVSIGSGFQSLPLRGRWHGEAVTEGVCMGLALVGENGGTPCGETPCGGTPSVSAEGAASSLREGALGFCPTDSPARAAPAKREAFRFDALQTPAQTNCARGSHSGSADHSGAPSSEQTALRESRPSGRLHSVPFVPPLPTKTASLGFRGGPRGACFS